MKKVNNQALLLDMIDRPVFFVEDGRVCQVNQAARKLQIEENIPAAALLGDSLQAYLAFTEGVLFLQLSIQGLPCMAAVTRAESRDLFVLDESGEDIRLQAMALAAQQLRVPLSAAMTAAELLGSSPSVKSDPGARHHAEQLNRSLFQLLRQISNMADTGRYGIPGSLRMENMNFKAFFQEILEKAHTLTEKSQVRFHYSGLRSTVTGLGCPEALERAVYNLISNAAKFADRGGQVEARVTASQDTLTFMIQNSGSGIPKDVIANIFARYRRQPCIEDGRHGIGLGMTLIRSVASAHGGTVLIDEPEENLTRVTMTLKLRKDAAAVIRSPVLSLGDYAGGWDHGCLELADFLPLEAYEDF